MPSIPLEKLLEPVSGAAPCGPSLDDEVVLGNLWREIENGGKGTPEQQFGETIIPAKPPDWKDLHGKCLQLLADCRHLGAAIYITACALELDGLAGLRDGLKLIHGFVDTFWRDLHPLPDPDDPEDFYEREGLLEMLAVGYQESTSDTLRIAERIRKAPLTRSQRLGELRMVDVLALRAGTPGAPTRELLEAAFADTDKAWIEDLEATVKETVDVLASLGERLNAALGDGAPNLSNVRKELDGVLGAVSEFTVGGNRVVPESPEVAASSPASLSTAPAGGGGGHVAAAAPTAPGRVGSREDVVAALNAVIAYYRQNEPTSPVPFLLDRAKKLVNNDFLGVIRNFRPDLEQDFFAILGITPYEDGEMKPAPVPPKSSAPAATPSPEPDTSKEDPWKNARF